MQSLQTIQMGQKNEKSKNYLRSKASESEGVLSKKTVKTGSPSKHIICYNINSEGYNQRYP